VQLVEELVHAGEIVLDIGASRGFFSERLAQLVGPRGHVHLFEPHPANAEWLRKLCGARHNMTLHTVALSDVSGTATLSTPLIGGRAAFGMSTLEHPAAREHLEEMTDEVVIRRLDDIISGRQRVAFVKCDVEGHEAAVLRGGEDLLRRDRPTILIEIEQRHRTEPVHDTFRFLEEQSYNGYAIRSDALIPLTEFDVERDQLVFLDEFREAMPPEYVHNFLFVSSDRDVWRAAGRTRLNRVEGASDTHVTSRPLFTSTRSCASSTAMKRFV
jgi:FkbM family methyltransferase